VSTRPDPRAKERFLEALELREEEREAFLDRLEPGLAGAVRQLLAAYTTPRAERLEEAPRQLRSVLGTRTRTAGQRLGDYELLEEIGAGAHGTVWRARQVSLGRVVALKVLRVGMLAHPRDREQLRSEAEAIARLDHPHIVPVYEVGEEEDYAFFSMRYLEGGSLAARPHRPWPLTEAVRLLIDVARGVHHAHQRGLLHRDLKPSNVLLDADGRAAVADFGIAKRLDSSSGATTTRALAGTPAYMAPEQATGGELTVTTDVWALGCLAYELLAGRPAFGGGSVTEILRRVREAQPAPLSVLRREVPRDLETIVLTCLRKEAERRYASANALADDLERWMHHEPIQARRTTAVERGLLFCRRSPLTASLIGVVSGLVLLMAVLASWASLELSKRLRDSYLDQARATRLVGDVGSRGRALDLLARAARIRPGGDLSDEAIACLAATDLQPVRRTERDPSEVLLGAPGLQHILAMGVERARILAPDGRELVDLGTLPDLRDARLSRDGLWLLTKHHAAGSVRQDPRLRLEEVATRRVLWEKPVALALAATDFDASCERLALGTLDGGLTVVGVRDGNETLRLELERRIWCLGFSPDGGRLALVAGEEPSVLEEREAASGALLRSIPLTAPAFDLAWLPDGRTVAVGSNDFRIHLIDLRAEDEAQEARRVVCEGHAAEVTELFVSDAAPLLASNSWDETTRLWDTSTGRQVRVASARSLGFSSGGDELAFVDADSLGAWRVEHGNVLEVLRAHEGKAPRDLDFSEDGTRLATAGSDKVCLWRLGAEARPERVLPGAARSALFLDGGRRLLTSGETGLWLHELETTAPPRCAWPAWTGEAVRSADGNVVAALGRHELLLFDPRAPEDVRALPGAANMEYLSLSADGGRVAAGNWRGEGVRLWRPRESEEPATFLAGLVNVAVALSADGRLLATASSEAFELWSTETLAPLFRVERWPAFGRAPAPVAFRPDGRAAAFAISAEVVRVIDTRTFATLATLEPPDPQSLFELAFSPDGRTLGAACGTNRIQLWNLAALEDELRTLGLATR